MALKEKILELRENGKGYREIAITLNCARSTVGYHCQRNGLNNFGVVKTKKIPEDVIEIIKQLKKDGLSNIKISKKLNICESSVRRYTSKRDSSYSKHVKNFRHRRKLKAVAYKGGKCSICDYNKCMRALSFHHLDPSKKDFAISSGDTMAWDKTKLELDKCILVCSNCHAEIHDNIIKF